MCTREMHTSGMGERYVHVYYIERCTHREWMRGICMCTREMYTSGMGERYVHVY